MKTQPITPAHIVFGDMPEHPPAAVEFGDIYHPRVGAAAQARHVFLQGNGLPQRWSGRARFVIFESGFGLGHNFIETWRAWRDDPQRCTTLHYVAIDKHPPRLDDLQRVHATSDCPDLTQALLSAWPPLTANLHLIDLAQGRLRLLLGWGDVATLLPAMRLRADAIYLDGFAPARNPGMWQPRVLATLGRKAAAGATVATWSVARALRDGLTTAGFEIERLPGIGGKREITVGRFAPRHVPRSLPDAAVADRRALVIGAGLAGAATARALAGLGWAVTVLDRREHTAAEASGNAAGLFHGIVASDDGRYARLYRSASQCAARDFGSAMAAGAPGQFGLLRLQTADDDLEAMRRLLQRQQFPEEWVRALAADEASAKAGVPLGVPAWWYPTGGWISPAGWVRQALAHPSITVIGRADVTAIAFDGADWHARNGNGQTLARAPALVLANAAGAEMLLRRGLADRGLKAASPWALSQTRGQVSRLNGHTGLRLAVAGDGYAIPLADAVLCGATRQPLEAVHDHPDEAVFDADRQANLLRLRRLTGIAGEMTTRPSATDITQTDRAGRRLQADDRMPIAGALPALSLWSQPAPSMRRDQARLLPREPGLFVVTALGSRGLTLAPLLGRLVAAQADGSPWPLEQDLVDAVDPGRWLVRAARSEQTSARGSALAGDQPAEVG